jgi:ribosome-associated heat shock protein Hsp15
LPDADRIRLDKWLWQARFFKTRGLAADVIGSGRVRLNGQPCRKAGHAVAPGDTLSFPTGPTLRLVRVLLCGTRRGPATEAQMLYADLTEPSSASSGGLATDRASD